MKGTHLYTFWISHFSEKVRWGLEFEGISFEEHALLPGPHVLTLKRISGQQQVPVLVHGEEVLQGSGAILDALPRLFGKSRLQPWCETEDSSSESARRAQEIETLADRAFGKAIQAYGYDLFLQDRKKVVDAWSYLGPWWSRAFYKLTFPAIERALRAGYCRSPEHVEKARVSLLSGFDEIDALLAKSDYLLGDVPTRADVAVASLLCPLVRPTEHPLPWPTFPEKLEAFCEQLSGRPTFEFVKRMYRDHRTTRND